MPLAVRPYGCRYLYDILHQTPLAVPSSLAPHDHRIIVPSAVLSSLAWWSNPNKVRVRTPFNPPTRATILTDAFLTGWSAHLDYYTAQGTWTPQEAWLHINLLELREICLVCKGFLYLICSLHVQILSDNITTVVYIPNREERDLVLSSWRHLGSGTDVSGIRLPYGPHTSQAFRIPWQAD